ncbi:hypothetical protein [Microbacterium gorillae]|uniref:hypothetical protein n=1 Tax=Microbacterium gorillae TaxID=1231063 RepID=UPI003D9938F9
MTAGTPGAGQFTTKSNSAPSESLQPSEGGRQCSMCRASPATFRVGGVNRGYRAADEPHYCVRCAASEAAEGTSIEFAPLPQQRDERLTWLVEGDDHEYVTVEALTADDALEEAAMVFTERYDERCNADSLELIAGFRDEDGTGYSDGLKWVPGTGVGENDAYKIIDEANL